MFLFFYNLLHGHGVSAVTDEGALFFFPLHHAHSDFSTGYLEDALVEFSEHPKRRKLFLYSDDNETNDSMDFKKVRSYPNSSYSISNMVKAHSFDNFNSPA